MTARFCGTPAIRRFFNSSGSELVANGAFASDLSSWTDSGTSWSWSSGTALHAAGSVSTLTQNLTITSGSTYQVAFSISGRTAGTVAIALGSVSLVSTNATTTFTASSTRSLVAAENGLVAFVITPSSDFDGKVDNVSVKEATLGSVPASLTVIDGSANQLFALRPSLSGQSNVFVGSSCARSVFAVAAQNTGFGNQALYGLTSGTDNSAFGYQAAYAINNGKFVSAFGAQAAKNTTSGTYVNAFGAIALAAATTGYNLSAFGSGALSSMTSSYNASALGHSAATNMTSCNDLTAIGANAARFLAGGSTPATAATNSVYLGSQTKLSADGVTNENVFGYNATGIGSNSCVIGSSAVTKCQIFGDVILDKTVTAAGTTGAQTINKTCGSVNFAAAAASLVVTNNRVTTSSVILATVGTNDATMKRATAVAASGSFTLYPDATPTAETRVNWLVIN